MVSYFGTVPYPTDQKRQEMRHHIMIQVAICDDEPKTLHELEAAVAHYAVQRDLHLSVDTYQCAKDLEAQIEHHKTYQIYVLDMLMPQMNGIEIGQAIRRLDQQTAIIYLTTTMDFAFQAFGVFAQRYLLKPVNETEFHEALDFAVGNALQMQKTLNVKTASGIQRIPYSKIEYIENAARALHIYTTDKNEIVSRLLRKSFENDIGILLENQDFIHTHKSFIVNLSHVRVYDTNQMAMRSGAQIPISKSRQTEVKRAYLQYISENY